MLQKAKQPQQGGNCRGPSMNVCGGRKTLPCKSAIIDGEVVVPDENRSRTSLRSSAPSVPGRLGFVAFELLHLDGRDLRSKPLIECQQKLWELVKAADSRLQCGHSVENDPWRSTR
jgi:ATP-dependent DNA ligase